LAGQEEIWKTGIITLRVLKLDMM